MDCEITWRLIMSDYKDYGWELGGTDAHKYLYKTLCVILKNDKEKIILDIGCGNGSIANSLIEDGFNVYGIDASKSGIEIANNINPGRFFLHTIGGNSDIPKELRDIDFSIVISTEVIEHLYSPRDYIGFIKDMLPSRDAKVVISTPYHGYLKNLVMALMNKTDEHYTVLWDGGHIKFWSVRTLKLLLNEFGYRVVKFKGSGRIPFLWKSMFIVAKLK